MTNEELQKEMIAAMKAKDKVRLSIIRQVKAEVKNIEVNERRDVTEEDVNSMIKRLIKQTSETLEMSIKAGTDQERTDNLTEQVKILADQSTEAAGETTKLIESTIDAVNKGIAIAEESEASMDQVMEEAEVSTKRMVDMAQALQAEVSSVQQIDENIAHVAGIVDNNSASSQETAAVSEEQSAQVHTMLQLMHQFQI